FPLITSRPLTSPLLPYTTLFRRVLFRFLRDFGLPGALWLAAKQSGLWPLLESLWPAPRSGPGPAHYLLLAAIHRICDPGPKTEVSDWYDRTILASEWGFPAERFTSQAFWDAFEQI